MSDIEQKHWLIRPGTIHLIWRYGIAILAILVIADFFVEPHPYFQIDGTFGFFSWYGLITCILMVVFAKALGFFIKRSDTYYDE